MVHRFLWPQHTLFPFLSGPLTIDMDELFLFSPTWEHYMQNCADLSTTLETICDKTCLCVLLLLSIRYPTHVRREVVRCFSRLSCITYHVARCPHGPSVLLLMASALSLLLAEQHPLVCVHHIFLAPSSIKTPGWFPGLGRRERCCGGRCVACASVNNRFQVFWVDAQKMDCGVAQ